MFDKKYQLPMTVDYVGSWGLIEAVRELIQNCLDSESPFEYEFKKEDYDTHSLSLRSKFSVLPAKTLLLGSSSKSDNSDAIGSFGEGYKIALLVLARIEKPVVIENGVFDWVPSFQYSKTFEDNVLTVTERRSDRKTSVGLEFIIGDLSDDEVEQIKMSCLKMQDKVGEVKTTVYGDILLDSSQSGKLYVGGLFICDTGMTFGYNIFPKYVTLERDRKTVDSWDLGQRTKDMWLDTNEFDRIAQMIEDEIEDIRLIKYNCPEIVKEACYNVFRERNPKSFVATSQKEMEEMIKKGMTKTVYVGTIIGDIIKSSSEYKSSLLAVNKSLDISPERVLTDWYDKSKYHMHDKIKEGFREILVKSKNWK